ncbi:MAG: GntR family transcriptional regulator [Anaerolineales bacterium]|nr:GntR family transcriptional regulator [Anaerolineales bacterium]
MNQLLNSNQAKPLYQIVADTILAQIEGGDYSPGERLPSESELVNSFGVGRNTVRHALSELADQGVIRTVQGVGSFVETTRYSKTANFLLGFSQEMERTGKATKNQVLDARIISADPFLARRLQTQLGAEVVFLHRLRMLDGEPVANERAYLPHRLCPGILEYDFTTASLYQILSSQYNMKPESAEQEIIAELATDEIARLLGLTQPAVVLVFHRETSTADGRVIEYVDSEFRGDRFQFYTHLKADTSQQPFVFQRSLIDRNWQEE